MRHSQEVDEAMEAVFEELLALSPEEFTDRLKKTDMGSIGYLMKETDTIDCLYEKHVYKEKKFF